MTSPAKPRLAFLGVGWIGRLRLQALIESGCADVVAIADPSPEMLTMAHPLVPNAWSSDSLADLLSLEPDGLVIATPSALHAAQCIAALERGVSVFCQKPLGRNAKETTAVVSMARRADRLLDVDFSYRHTRAALALRDLVRSGELGDIYGARLTFHNAYGPDKPWYLDRTQSGGGCLVDLGIHLVDLALWLLPGSVQDARGRLFAKGKRLARSSPEVEDYATASIDLASGANVDLVCSWHAHAGRDAVIEVELYGSQGGARLCNEGGSFYDFSAYRMQGTTQQRLVEPPDAWGGRALVKWAQRLAESRAFDSKAEDIVATAQVLDLISAQT
jgi:predicted dehydrogenase